MSIITFCTLYDHKDLKKNKNIVVWSINFSYDILNVSFVDCGHLSLKSIFPCCLDIKQLRHSAQANFWQLTSNDVI